MNFLILYASAVMIYLISYFIASKYMKLAFKRTGIYSNATRWDRANLCIHTPILNTIIALAWIVISPTKDQFRSKTNVRIRNIVRNSIKICIYTYAFKLILLFTLYLSGLLLNSAVDLHAANEDYLFNIIPLLAAFIAVIYTDIDNENNINLT